jgi:hypothetical protein
VAIRGMLIAIAAILPIDSTLAEQVMVRCDPTHTSPPFGSGTTSPIVMVIDFSNDTVDFVRDHYNWVNNSSVTWENTESMLEKCFVVGRQYVHISDDEVAFGFTVTNPKQCPADSNRIDAPGTRQIDSRYSLDRTVGTLKHDYVVNDNFYKNWRNDDEYQCQVIPGKAIPSSPNGK